MTLIKHLNKKEKEKVSSIVNLVILIIITAAVMLPIWWILRTSLMTNSEMYAFPPSFFPKHWLFSNYAETLEIFKFWQYLFNTMMFVVPAVAGGTITATLCGYAMARFKFKGKGLLFAMMIGSMLLPNMVTLIPQYLMFTRILGWGNTYWPLIVPYFFGGGAFNIFLIMQFIKTIPRDLDEAAIIDGATNLQILLKIILPAIKPVMIVVSLFLFIVLWNDLLLQTVYINTPDKFTIAIGLSMFKSGLKADWAKTMAATCLSFLPGLIIYFLGQRHFVEGIVMTGIKE